MNNTRHLLTNSPQIVNGQGVGSGGRDAISAAFVLGVNHIGANGLDEVQNVLLACHADGDHEDKRRGANHHAQSRKQKLYLVAAEGVEREVDNFTKTDGGALSAIAVDGGSTCHC